MTEIYVACAEWKLPQVAFSTENMAMAMKRSVNVRALKNAEMLVDDMRVLDQVGYMRLPTAFTDQTCDLAFGGRSGLYRPALQSNVLQVLHFLIWITLHFVR